MGRLKSKDNIRRGKVTPGKPWMCVGIVLAILLLSTGAFAQFKRQFKEAKDLFDKKDYTHSMDAFKSLIGYAEENPYAPYASYYYGLSADKLGYSVVAKDIFLQIRKLYPKWDQIDEVNYVLAKTYFDQHEYFRALQILAEIKKSSTVRDAVSMKRFYLSQITDPEILRMVLEDNPRETEAARALLKAISLQPPPAQDRNLFDSLLAVFHFNRKDFVSDISLVSVKKDRYTVSLLLPFLASTLEPSPVTKRNQFVLDLYVGMKMAADTLAKQGIYLDLNAYDAERSVEMTRKVLSMEELKSSDLIVGPLFQDQSKLVLEFSEKNKINMINPVSNNSEFIGHNPFALLYQPAQETLGTRSAELVAAQARNKNCIVYFGETPKDSVKAFSFMKKANELGISIVYAEEIRKENSSKIFTTLATGKEFDEFRNPTQFTMKRDSIGSIYVATDDPVIYTKVISGVETRGDSILIVGNESWIAEDNTTVDYGIYERLQILLEAPNYIPMRDPVYVDFKKKYIRQHGVIPSDYARLGYDFLYFVGQSLHRYGVYFQTGLSQATDTTRFGRYDFRDARDNQRVPFVAFRSGEVVEVPVK